MSLRSIADIQTDLDAVRAARIKAITAQTYTLDTTQTRQSVTRANLTEINKTIRQLESELERAEAADRGDSGIVALNFRRNV